MAAPTQPRTLRAMLLGTFMLGALALWPACSVATTVRFTSTDHGIRVEIRRLGDYPGAFVSARVTEKDSGVVLWSIVAQEGTMQLHTIELNGGQNPATPARLMGKHKVLAPKQGDSFLLQAKVKYECEVCLTTSSNSCERDIFHVR